MKVLFKQPHSINGVDYSKGTHEVPDSLEGHWYFQACKVNGSISIVEKGGQAVIVPEVPKAPEEPKPPVPSYQEEVEEPLDIKALQKQAKELGLKAGGKAADIKARIDKFLAEQGEAKAAQ